LKKFSGVEGLADFVETEVKFGGVVAALRVDVNDCSGGLAVCCLDAAGDGIAQVDVGGDYGEASFLAFL
jgi:hypothetical protein